MSDVIAPEPAPIRLLIRGADNHITGTYDEATLCAKAVQLADTAGENLIEWYVEFNAASCRAAVVAVTDADEGVYMEFL